MSEAENTIFALSAFSQSGLGTGTLNKKFMDFDDLLSQVELLIKRGLQRFEAFQIAQKASCAIALRQPALVIINSNFNFISGWCRGRRMLRTRAVVNLAIRKASRTSSDVHKSCNKQIRIFKSPSVFGDLFRLAAIFSIEMISSRKSPVHSQCCVNHFSIPARLLL